MQIALLNGAAEAALAQYEVSSLDGLKESDLKGEPYSDKGAQEGDKLGEWTSKPPSTPLVNKYLLWVIDPKITQ